MPRTMQTERRKATGGPPPGKQNASSYNTKQHDEKIIDYYMAGLNDSDLVISHGIRYEVKKAESLRLDCNNITLSDGKLIDAILAKSTTLNELRLSDNNIGPRGVKHLTDALKNNNTLQDLYLYGNNIDDEGAKYIADMLAVNKKLRVIELGNNNIGDKGAQSIATSLVVNIAIRYVLLHDNKIGDKGAEKLADALESNHSIKTLDLYYNNNISNRVRDRINAILDDPKRQGTNQQSSLDQMNHFIAKKDAVIAKKDKEITDLKDDLASKDKEIASLKECLKNSKSIETVDLTSGDGTEHTSNKRQRTEAKSYLAIQHEQNLKIVQVKEEKIAAETALEDVREDLEDSQEDMGRQVLFTDFLQSKIDELAALAEAGGVDRALVVEIKGRSYSSMSS